MAEALKILGQARPAATTLTDLYAVPTTPSTQAVVPTIVVCNTSTTAVTFRIHARLPGAAASTLNALFYDAPLGPTATTVIGGLGLGLAAGSILTVQASAASVTFTASGQELT